MTRQYNLEWLAQEGFEYTGYILSFFPPNYLTYAHPDGRKANLEDTEEGVLEVRDKRGRLIPPTPSQENDTTLAFFREIIHQNTTHRWYT